VRLPASPGAVALGALGWVWTAVAVVPWILVAARLPDPVAVHWGFGPTPEASLPLLVLFTAVFGLAGAAAVVTTALVAARELPASTRRPGVTAMAALGAFGAGVSVLILRVNLDAPRWDAAGDVGPAAMAAPALVAGAAAWAVRVVAGSTWGPSAGTDGDGDVRDAGDLVRWSGTADARWPWLVLAVGALVAWGLVTAVSALLVLVVVPAAGLLLTFTVVRVEVGPDGVVSRLGPLGGPVVAVPLDRIEGVRATHDSPVSWQTWGYRGSLRWRSRAALSLRSGDALVLDLRGGRRFLVTVDGADRAAAVLHRHLPAEADRAGHLTPAGRPGFPGAAGPSTA
jgi:hypothetical protein